MIKITNGMRLLWILKKCTILFTSRDGWTQRKIETVDDVDRVIVKVERVDNRRVDNG